jgi:ABC-type nickel/cobalt efflux system permease component RcnA
MSAHHDTMGWTVTKVFGWVAAWLGSITVADVQPWVAVISGSLVAILAAINIWKALN